MPRLFKSLSRAKPVLRRTLVTIFAMWICLIASATGYAADNSCQAVLAGSPIVVEVLDSDRAMPELHRRSFDLSDAQQPEPNKLVKGKITLEIVDPFLGDVSLKRVRDTGRTTLFEDYAFQVVFAADKAYEFYEEIGISLPPVTIRIQDPETPPLAGRTGRTLSFMRFKSLEKVEGSALNIRDAIPLISDVVAHEMTHFAQGDATGRLESGRLGNTSYEGHANLMAYLMVGRSDLGVFPGREPDMRVYVPAPKAKFGRMQGGNYDSYQPFSSVLYEIHKQLLDKASNATDRQARHHIVSRLYFDLVAQAKGTETYRDLAIKVIVGLRKARLLDRAMLATVRKLFYERGLDLDRKETDGFFAGFLVNGKTPDRGKQLLIADAKAIGAADPSFEIQEGLLHDPDIQWPVTGVLVGESTLKRANEIMLARFQELAVRGERPTREFASKVFVESLIEAGKDGVDLGGAIVEDGPVRFNENNRRITFKAREGRDSTKCLLGFAESNLMLFDAHFRMIGQATLLFLCR